MIYSDTFWELLYLKKIEIYTEKIEIYTDNSIEGMDIYDLYVYCMIAIKSWLFKNYQTTDRKPHWRQRKQFRSK